MHYVVIVLGILLGLLFWQYTEQVEAKVEAQVAAKVNEKSLEFQQELSRANAAHNEIVAGLKADAQRKQDENIATINTLRLSAERRAEEDPNTFGDDFALELYRISCRVRAGSNRDLRARCDHLTPEAGSASISLTVTPDLADKWADSCEQFRDETRNEDGILTGNEAHCAWSITGFTPQGGYNILSWLEQVDRYALQQAEHIDGLHEFINANQEKDNDGDR
jgi:hypothetical protein